MQYIISVDIGTTALKSSIVQRDGIIAASSSEGYPLMTQGASVEQDPTLWWEAFCRTALELTSKHPDLKIEAIVLSGQMQDLIMVEKGVCTEPAILYSDTRSQPEFTQFTEDLGLSDIKAITGNTPDASGLPAKLMMLKNRQKLTALTTFLTSAHDYLCWKLTGRSVTDPTNAATTGLMHYENSDWDQRILSYLGIDHAQLPIIEPAGKISGSITIEAAALCGLPAGLPVIHGAGDAASSTVGAGAGIPGVYSCYLGTSGWVASTVSCPIDPSYGVFNLKHPNREDTIAIGAMRTTGGNISWLIDSFEIDDNNKYETLQKIASHAAPGSSGLFYLPYLQGERSPFQDPHARGAYVGISRSTRKPELFRSVLEGICYGLASIYQKIETGTGVAAKYVVVSGGGAEDKLLTEILASVLGVPVHVAAVAAHNGVLGSSVIAGKALGWTDSYMLPEQFLQIERIIIPNMEIHRFYQKQLEVFHGLYPALQDEFHIINDLNE